MASQTQEDLTDRIRSQHLDQSPELSTEDLDESEVTSEEVHSGDDMNNVSSIQPSEQSPSHEMQVLPEDMFEIAPLVSYNGKPNEESTTLGKNHFGGIISNEEDLISQLVLIDTSPEKILLIFLVKIIIDVSQKHSVYKESPENLHQVRFTYIILACDVSGPLRDPSSGRLVFSAK